MDSFLHIVFHKFKPKPIDHNSDVVAEPEK